MLHNDLAHARLWLEFALADLSIARVELPVGGKYELLLFHAQQAVEKSLKAILTYNEIEFPYTHNLQRLVELVPDSPDQHELLLASTVLTEYSVITRYPGEFEPVDFARYQRLLKIAEQVYTWALTVIQDNECLR